MVTWIYSGCKFCYCVHTIDRNPRSMFFLTIPWNTTCGWWLGFTQPVSFAINSVHTNDNNLRPIFFLTIYALKHNLWMGTRIHSARKLCYSYYVHTNNRNLRPIFSLTMPLNTTFGWSSGFTLEVSYAMMYTSMIILSWSYPRTQALFSVYYPCIWPLTQANV